MAAEFSVQESLESFANATESATQGIPDVSALTPPENGITLLDTKNEIFLSYLQALALRNLNVLRSIKSGGDAESTRKISNEITKKLVEHRVYLERGVRPLEQKIKYQVDRVIKAADDEERAKLRRVKDSVSSDGRRVNGSARQSGSEDESDESDEDSEDDSDGGASGANDVDAASFRPNPKAMQLAPSEEKSTQKVKSSDNGVYRPPRISATAMPEPDRRERAERRPPRSRTLDEYVSTEISTAPLAQPSIGSNIALGGRRNKDARQLAEEKERRDYEEANLVRLPKESKKERAKKGLRGRDAAGGFGGEDWRDIGNSVDRIGDLTRKKSKDNALERSRKRRAVEDSPRDNGIGSAFDLKKRRVMRRKG